MARGVWRRLLVAALVAAAALLGTRGVAGAHAGLVSAEPGVGARLAASPPRLRLVFSEPLEARLTRVTLIAADGRETRLTVAGDPHDVHAVIAPLEPLAPGAYRVSWRIVSADGHPVDGSYVFAIGTAAPTDAPPEHEVGEEEAPAAGGPSVFGAPVVASAVRGGAVGATMALGGLLLFLAWPAVPGAPAPRRATRLATGLAVAAALLCVAHLVAWLQHAAAGEPLAAFAADGFASGPGRVELARTGFAVLALWAIGLARRPRLALPFALGAVLVGGAAGHASAISPAIAIPAKALHLVAAAAWLGGLLWLLAREPDAPDAFLRQALRVSAVGLAAVILVTLSGVVQTLLFLPSPLDVVRSAYGAVTLAKVVGLLVLVGYGAHHRFRALPKLAGDAGAATPFAGTLRQEVVVMAVVVLIGALLANVPPPSHPAVAPTAATPSAP